MPIRAAVCCKWVCMAWRAPSASPDEIAAAMARCSSAGSQMRAWSANGKRQTQAVADTVFKVAGHLQQTRVAGELSDELMKRQIKLRGADQIDGLERLFKAGLYVSQT